MAHKQPHELSGKVVTIKSGQHSGKEYRVEDYWDRVGGGSWMNATGNPACLIYAMRSATDRLPLDNEVLYGKIGGAGHLVHVSEVS